MDHSHMDHSKMDHSHMMGHGDMDHGGDQGCNMHVSCQAASPYYDLETKQGVSAP